MKTICILAAIALLAGGASAQTAIVVEPGELTGERFAAYQTAQFVRWKEIIKSLDIPVE